MTRSETTHGEEAVGANQRAAKAPGTSIKRPVMPGKAGPERNGEPARRSNTLSFDGGRNQLVFASLTPKAGDTTPAQLSNLLEQLTEVLGTHEFGRDAVAKVNVFLRNSRSRHCVRRMLRSYFGKPPVTNFIIQPPAGGEHLALEILGIRGRQVRIEKLNEHLTIVRDDDCRWAYVGGIEPAAGDHDTYHQALTCFRQLQRHLVKAGFHFNQVVRTWIYERNIIANERCKCGKRRQRYQIMNDARRQFFTSGNGPGKPFSFFHDLPPASTGIGMSGGAFVMECLALDVPKDKIEVTPLKNPEQIDAHAYTQEVLLRGAASIKAAPLFSRGMSICTDYRMLLISGTASIKGQETVCLDDAEGQTRTTLENIDLVLGQAEASLRDVQQARVYIKSDESKAREEERTESIRGVVEAMLPGIPKLYLIADVCRDNLLVEIEALSFVKSGKKASPDGK